MQKIVFSGQLRKINPNRLIKEEKKDEVANFFLVLGCFYNDLKSLSFHLIQMANFFESTDNKVSIKRGEFGGIRTHLEKLMTATIHEFFNFINEKKKILETTEFKFLYEELNRDLKDKWDAVVNISTNDKKNNDSDFFRILLEIRNNLAFHYKQAGKVLKKGFIDFFYNDEKNDSNEFAYYSIGETMSDIRFFYCDAAVQRSIIDEVTSKMDSGEYTNKLRETVENINFTIMSLIKIYLKGRPY